RKSNEMNDVGMATSNKSFEINHLASVPDSGTGCNSNRMNELTQNPGYFPLRLSLFSGASACHRSTTRTLSPNLTEMIHNQHVAGNSHQIKNLMDPHPGSASKSRILLQPN
ncbi:MAG TPA: hypothetical protein VMI06_04590, partial [Terriglobia bacterium]|nr:hypothetical protein [Terriglobia bacterium]